MNLAYHKSIELLHRVASPNGFLASAETRQIIKEFGQEMV